MVTLRITFDGGAVIVFLVWIAAAGRVAGAAEARTIAVFFVMQFAMVLDGYHPGFDFLKFRCVNNVLVARRQNRRDQYIIDTSEFQEIKARMIAIQNHRKLHDEKDGDRPGLRRTSNAPGSSDPDKKDDDRPTVKRNPQGDHP